MKQKYIVFFSKITLRELFIIDQNLIFHNLKVTLNWVNVELKMTLKLRN